ncbi:MAG TPA: polysaccharide deacetylase family protein [Cyclobacteriaceae bacterium]|nr:polysaccharide deacetylase family protein [Cyclobacteriaceae bacterium]HPW60777.1 polysaccharide deacetylase family protein [Cyclobacteriaceae bacterium]
MIPFRTPFFLPWLFPDLVWRIPTKEKKIFLTFDDGPVPGPTEFVLTTLKKFDARATFFCIGDNVRKYPNVFTQIAEAGHSIGNHTFNHLKGWNFSTKDYLANVESCTSQIALGYNSKSPVNSQQWTVDGQLFRPPYGRITRNQIRLLKESYKIIMWDVLTCDYSQSVSPVRCFKGSLEATRPGSIVVFHDSLKAERNLTYVLPRYLEYFSKQGFVFSAL